MKSLTKLFLFALSIFVYGCNSLDIKPLDIITDGDILSSQNVFITIEQPKLIRNIRV